MVHANDRRRVVRALELADAGASLAPDEDRLWSEETRHPTLVVGLDVPKDVLERRIEERTRAMFDAGVQEEVRHALEGPISRTARQALGLEEVATFELTSRAVDSDRHRALFMNEEISLSIDSAHVMARPNDHAIPGAIAL